MLRQERLDILDICLPTYLHVDTAVKAMEKGIHVICEKPISTDPGEVARAYDTAERMGVKFMIAQVLRFWPEYELLKEVYDTKRYGKLLSGYMDRLGPIPKWSWDNWMLDERKSGLVPYDLHVHDLDFLVYAFGQPQDVRCDRSKRPEQDHISVTYRYPEMYVTAEAAWYAAPLPFSAGYRFQFEEALVTYRQGKCVIYQNDGTVIDMTDHWDAGAETGNDGIPQSDAYANEIRYFKDCVLTGKAPDKVKPQELETVIRILNDLK
jgi:predicted dehydrogenase